VSEGFASRIVGFGNSCTDATRVRVISAEKTTRKGASGGRPAGRDCRSNPRIGSMSPYFLFSRRAGRLGARACVRRGRGCVVHAAANRMASGLRLRARRGQACCCKSLRVKASARSRRCAGDAADGRGPGRCFTAWHFAFGSRVEPWASVALGSSRRDRGGKKDK